MKNENIRILLDAETFESFAGSETCKEKIASGEISDVCFGCGDNVTGVYVTFDNYEDALEAHDEEVADAAEDAVKDMVPVLESAKSEYKERGCIDPAEYGIAPHDWITEAIEQGWGSEELAKRAKKDIEDFTWIALVNLDEDGHDDSGSIICLLY